MVRRLGHGLPLRDARPTWTRRFAKYQLILLCREWFQHPNGALPAYEWDFGDVNPPVQAWAALEVFAIDGGRDIDFLSRVFDKLMVNFTWWVNLEDAEGNNLLRGRVPRSRQHRPDRPFPPAGRRHAGAVRRHRLDGLLRAVHAGHRRRAEPQRPAASGGPGPQVRRALRGHPRGHGQPGSVGRRRRDVLRPPRHPRRDRRTRQGPLHGRRHPSDGCRRRR